MVTSDVNVRSVNETQNYLKNIKTLIEAGSKTRKDKQRQCKNKAAVCELAKTNAGPLPKSIPGKTPAASTLSLAGIHTGGRYSVDTIQDEGFNTTLVVQNLITEGQFRTERRASSNP